MARSWGRVFVGIAVCGAAFALPASAYDRNNPPFPFDQRAPQQAPDEPLADKDVPAFIKKDLASFYVNPKVYQLDVDGNGMQDYVVFVHPLASALLDQVHIYLKKPKGGYQAIAFLEDVGAGIEDIVDINLDGKWEFLLASLCESKRQNYIAYSVYQVRNGRLVNVDRRFKGFPKFVWRTDKKNDRDTVHLSGGERARCVAKMTRAIRYRKIAE